MHLASTDSGNDLLAVDPFALLVGMLLDQQVAMEKAFTSPDVLRERLGRAPARDGGRLDVDEVAHYDPAAFEELFRTPPALHRFPAAMAKRVQALAQLLIDEFGADPASVWTDADTGAQLIERLSRLPGFGAQKAKIFAALLAKQFGVQPPGWQEATGDYGLDGVHHSVADVTDAASLRAVREHKQQLKKAAKAKP